MRILIADDHEVVTRGVAAILSTRKGFAIIDDTSNGQKAVHKARETHPDLIIMDITMPVLDGFSAAKQIRSFLPRVPILFLSMHSGQAVEQQAKAVGAQGFVTKGEAGTTLLKAVETIIRKGTFFPS